MFSIRLARDAIRDINKLPAFHRSRILDEIERQLTHEPTSPSRNRKVLINLIPPWDAEPPIWELRVGDFRVFYDVSEKEATIFVRAVRLKPAGQRTEDIL